jgi:hypothetical protein
MNERIEALDDEAQEYAGRIAGNDEDSNYNAWFNIYKEKFAELIVQECVGRCEDIGSRLHSTNKEGSPGDGAFDCAVDLKKHFGVEE